MRKSKKINQREIQALEVYNKWKGFESKYLDIPETYKVFSHKQRNKKLIQTEEQSETKDICLLCQRRRKLTIDHIIPKWILIQTHIFDLKGIKVKENYRMICQECNKGKGGSIDYRIPMVREFMLTLAQRILEKVNSVDNST